MPKFASKITHDAYLPRDRTAAMSNEFAFMTYSFNAPVAVPLAFCVFLEMLDIEHGRCGNCQYRGLESHIRHAADHVTPLGVHMLLADMAGRLHFLNGHLAGL